MSNTYTAYISSAYPYSFRLSIGNAIISHIQKRSKNKRGIGGRRFKNYEDTYTKTTEFKAHGKSKTEPNLILTGEMLSDLAIKDISSAGKIVIGFKKEGNSEKSVWMREKGYDFLGLSNNELLQILSGFTPPDTQQVFDAALAEQLLGALTDGN